jgi:hypothetical protein
MAYGVSGGLHTGVLHTSSNIGIAGETLHVSHRNENQ